MGMLDHWHPMLPSPSLRRKPVGVRLAGRDIALFRTDSGKVGALDDMCPHRRMRLSFGSVIGEKLQCKYHGWTFDCAGNGESPGTPKLHACASTFDACEKYGYVWVKSKSSSPVMPTIDADDWCLMGRMEHVFKAPLELTLDNFCEIEHTATIHEFFGYPIEAMKDVTIRIDATDETVSVTTAGPPLKLNFLLRYLIGIKKNYVFNDFWTTHFSPVYSVFDHHWSDPVTGEQSWIKWRFYIFFTPVDDKATRLTTFIYSKSKWPVPPHGGLLPFRGFMRRRFIREVSRDQVILENLANHDTGLEGMKLSRFDRTLGLNRERIERIYRGNAPRAPEPTPEAE